MILVDRFLDRFSERLLDRLEERHGKELADLLQSLTNVVNGLVPAPSKPKPPEDPPRTNLRSV